MDNNSIIFLTLSMVCIYLLLDAFLGKQIVKNLVLRLFFSE